MTSNFKKGFTLIELLVVIAIIGILSSIVLASLNTARSRAKIAAAKSELSSMRAEAEIMYDTDTDYDDVCTTQATGENPHALWVEAAASVGADISDTAEAQCSVAATPANAWAAAVLIGTGEWFCVDSTGHADEYTGATPITANACT